MLASGGITVPYQFIVLYFIINISLDCCGLGVAAATQDGAGAVPFSQRCL